MITKVTVQGDLVEVEKITDGESKIIRRHVQDYYNLTNQEKQALWYEMAAEPQIEYLRTPKTGISKLFAFLKRKK